MFYSCPPQKYRSYFHPSFCSIPPSIPSATYSMEPTSRKTKPPTTARAQMDVLLFPSLLSTPPQEKTNQAQINNYSHAHTPPSPHLITEEKKSPPILFTKNQKNTNNPWKSPVHVPGTKSTRTSSRGAPSLGPIMTFPQDPPPPSQGQNSNPVLSSSPGSGAARLRLAKRNRKWFAPSRGHVRRSPIAERCIHTNQQDVCIN